MKLFSTIIYSCQSNGLWFVTLKIVMPQCFKLIRDVLMVINPGDALAIIKTNAVLQEQSNIWGN